MNGQLKVNMVIWCFFISQSIIVRWQVPTLLVKLWDLLGDKGRCDGVPHTATVGLPKKSKAEIRTDEKLILSLIVLNLSWFYTRKVIGFQKNCVGKAGELTPKTNSAGNDLSKLCKKQDQQDSLSELWFSPLQNKRTALLWIPISCSVRDKSI